MGIRYNVLLDTENLIGLLLPSSLFNINNTLEPHYNTYFGVHSDISVITEQPYNEGLFNINNTLELNYNTHFGVHGDISVITEQPYYEDLATGPIVVELTLVKCHRS